jgi:hypothetical protein
LRAELAAWRQAGRQPTLWWRDDDAGEVTPELNRLLSLSERLQVPVALAAIPADTSAALMRDIDGISSDFLVLVHGLRHRNHEPPGRKKSEFGPERDPTAVLQDLRQARALTHDRFGARARSIFVPPWNRFAERHLPLLAQAGYTGLSAKGPRGRPVTDITVSDVHVDIIAWREGRGFAGEAAVLAELVDHLAWRRRQAAAEPTGLLTHHRILDAAAWSFVAELVRVSREEGGVWSSADAVFSGSV